MQKNAIMMIDFALEAQRKEHKSAFDAIREACLLRFRPILMTTMAAMLGAMPLAFGHGVGSELRRPLGITIIGGLIFSQLLTLYTTPVIYLFFDGLAARFSALRGRNRPPPQSAPRGRRGRRSRPRNPAMNFSAPFIKRPIATTLLTVGAGACRASRPSGCCRSRRCRRSIFRRFRCRLRCRARVPKIMASSVATPLEREFGRIASVTEMTSQSTLGQTSITLQFDLTRNIDAATRDVESAINAARSYLPANLPTNPTYRKVNPADAPIMIIALTSDKLPPAGAVRCRLDGAGSSGSRRSRAWVRWRSAAVPRPRCAINVNPTQLSGYGLGLESVRTAIAAQTANEAKGSFARRERAAGRSAPTTSS